MDELIEACDTNFKDRERLRQLLINKPEKYGNNKKHVDAIYKEMVDFIAENVQSWEDARGGHYSFGIDSQIMNVPHGEVTGALHRSCVRRAAAINSCTGPTLICNSQLVSWLGALRALRTI